MKIFKCKKCEIYLKNGSTKWKSCTKAEHEVIGADDDFENEILETRKKVQEGLDAGLNDDESLLKLGTLMAVKKTQVDPKTPADRASAILSESIEKYSITKDDDGMVYFWIRRPDGSYDAFPHDSEKLMRFVTKEYSDTYNLSISRYSVTQAVGEHIAKGDVPGNVIEHTGKRVVYVDGTMWIDLRDNENSIFKVTKDHCGPTLPYSPALKILFEREGGSTMPMPLSDGNEPDKWLEWFANMLRIPKEKRMLFKVHVCHMLCMWQETPFMMMSGPEGSGKSVMATMIKELVDPVGMKATSTTLPTDETKLAMMLTKEQTRLFDNISYIPPQISDMLCQACTGGMHTMRELYTANNMLVKPFRKMRILLTGITKTTIRAPDLASRILHYDVPPGQAGDKSKDNLETDYYEKRPYILYAVLKTISSAMKEYDSNVEFYKKLPTKTRMTDFEKFGSAIAYVLGDTEFDAIKQYQNIMNDDMSMMVADEPLIRLTEEVMLETDKVNEEGQDVYQKLTRDYFARIRELATNDDTIDLFAKDWPKSITVLKRNIDRLKGAFQKRGITVDIGKKHGKDAIVRQQSHITITFVREQIEDAKDDKDNTDDKDTSAETDTTPQNGGESENSNGASGSVVTITTADTNTEMETVQQQPTDEHEGNDDNDGAEFMEETPFPDDEDEENDGMPGGSFDEYQ